MPRSALPQNYILNAGTVLENFDTVGEWVKGENGTIAQSTDIVKEGTGSIKIYNAAGTNTNMVKPVSLSLNGMNNVHLWIYKPPGGEDPLKFNFAFYTDGGYTNGYYYLSNSGADPNSVKLLNDGWNHLIVNRAQFTKTGSPDWETSTFTIIWFAMYRRAASPELTLYVDNMLYNVEQMPRLVFAFDDGWASVYEHAYPYMAARGIAGTIFVVPSFIGSANYMTLANLQTLYDAGWTLCNHTYSHSYLGTDPVNGAVSLADAKDRIERARDWLINHGFTRGNGPYYLAYPYGDVTGYAIQAAQETGMIAARCSNWGFQSAPVANYHLLNTRSIGSAVSLASTKGDMDIALMSGFTNILLGHKLAETAEDTNTWAISDFQALVDYVVAKRLKCVTIDEWYKGLTDPRYRSVPLSRSAM